MKKVLAIILVSCMLILCGCAQKGVKTFTVVSENDMKELTGIQIPLDSVRKTTVTAADNPCIVIEFNFMEGLYSESDYSIDSFRTKSGEGSDDSIEKAAKEVQTENTKILSAYVGYEKLNEEYVELLRKNYSPTDDSYFFDMHVSTYKCYNTRTENGKTTVTENAEGQLFSFKDKGIMVYIAKIPCPVDFKIG